MPHNRSGVLIALVSSLLFWPVPHAQAQQAASAGNTAAGRSGAASALARGWTAIAAGRPGEAAALAETVLADPWYAHDAVALQIAAAVTTGAAATGLEPYERWINTSGREDTFLLRPIAGATLVELARSQETRLRFAALSTMAAAGDRSARQTLIDAGQPGGASVEATTALAALGDRGAIARLQAAVAAGGTGDKTPAIHALRDAGGPGAGGAIAKALTDPAAPSRIAAANALAEMGATDAIPALKAALGDPDPAVRFMVSAALARLGAPQGDVTLESLAVSPMGDMRLFAAEAEAATNPSGRWTGIAQGLLRDPDPLVRLNAAELLVTRSTDPDAARAILTALADANPGVRAQAARILPVAAARGAVEVAALRALLRDPLPDVRLGAARSILAITAVLPK
jgi:HEAT repeat protein